MEDKEVNEIPLVSKWGCIIVGTMLLAIWKVIDIIFSFFKWIF